MWYNLPDAAGAAELSSGGAFYREIPCDATLFWGRLTWDKRVYESASRQ